ncbi:helix-turn-helix transcriptional regulator [Nocardioides ochotonae]|uniref:helix-turn-helix transcriptional regulator n=1 Tax=Nocardioides ochotonae TaxID=2685869 RepID=UPI0014085ECF|nr:helix-turn-helix domain-containing protein [Nocardioides ochotonae]
MRDSPLEELLEIEQVASLTGIPANTWRYWRQKGVGPRSARLGRRVKYRRSDIEEWIETQFRDAASH